MAKKIYTNIHQQLEKVSLAELMHASNIFGRGFGAKKLVLILEAYPTILTDPVLGKIQKISSVNGMAKKTAEQFVKEIPDFLVFLHAANLDDKLTNSVAATAAANNAAAAANNATYDKSHPLYGKKWVMTGFRDKELISILLAYGTEQGTTVNKKTTFLIVKNSDEENVKVADARQLGIPILTPEEVKITYIL